MNEVLEKIVGQIVGQLNTASAQREKDNLNLETIDVICGNLTDHLSKALTAASTKESIDEKYASLESSVKIIRQAVMQEPQKLRNAQRELEIKCSVYSEVLELIQQSQPVLEEQSKPAEQGEDQGTGAMPTLGSLVQDL